MNQKTTEAPSTPQGAEAETTETPERALLREVLAALELPWHANYEDRVQRLETIADRVNFVLGWVEGSLANEDGRVTLGMAKRAAEHVPVKYETEGGVR
jgi:hypothetical protein